MNCMDCGKKISSGRLGSNWCRDCGYGPGPPKRTHQTHQKPRVQQRQKQPLSFRQSQIKKQVDNYFADPFRYKCIVTPSSYTPQIVTVQTPRIRFVQHLPQCIIVKKNPVGIGCIGNKCYFY